MPRAQDDIPSKLFNRPEPVSWDGSYLGLFETKNVEFQKLNDRNYVILTYRDEKGEIVEQVCGYTMKVTTTLPCLFDELKPLFGLPKIGMHTFCVGRPTIRERHLIYRYGDQYDLSIPEYTRECKLSDELQRQIQYLFLFREIAAICSTREENIMIRNLENQTFPISLNEKSTKLDRYADPGFILTKDVKKSWFPPAPEIGHIQNPDLGVKEVARKMFGSQSPASWRSKIEREIRRVDRDRVWMARSLSLRIGILIK